MKRSDVCRSHNARPHFGEVALLIGAGQLPNFHQLGDPDLALASCRHRDAQRILSNEVERTSGPLRQSVAYPGIYRR